MALIREVRGYTPEIGNDTWLAENATVIGNVKIGENCSIWYNAVLRGDVNAIRIGNNTNIQDGAVIHTLYDGSKHPSQTHIGNYVSVGHNAIIHGAIIEDECLIGMGATILTGAVIGEGCIIGAGALVTGKMNAPAGSMLLGSPAKVVKELTEAQQAQLRSHAEHYLELAKNLK